MASEDDLGAVTAFRKNSLGRTELHTAVSRGDEEGVRQLLQSRADLDAKDGSGWTSLHLAAQEGHTQIIESLLNEKASTEATDGSGLTPLDLAIYHKQENAVKILQNAVPKEPTESGDAESGRGPKFPHDVTADNALFLISGPTTWDAGKLREINKQRQQKGEKELSDAQNAQRLLHDLEVSGFGHLGCGVAELLKGQIPEKTPLLECVAVTGTKPLITDFDLHLKQGLGKTDDGEDVWLEHYRHYSTRTKFGVLILAGNLHFFRLWAMSKACRREVEQVPDSRLFAYIEGCIVRVNKPDSDQLWTSHEVGPGAIVWSCGDLYLGPLKEKKQSGLGQMHFQDGEIYEGPFNEGKMHGNVAKYVFSDGSRLEGTWKSGSPILEKCRFWHSDGTEFQVAWPEKVLDPKGVLQFVKDNAPAHGQSRGDRGKSGGLDDLQCSDDQRKRAEDLEKSLAECFKSLEAADASGDVLRQTQMKVWAQAQLRHLTKLAPDSDKLRTWKEKFERRPSADACSSSGPNKSILKEADVLSSGTNEDRLFSSDKKFMLVLEADGQLKLRRCHSMDILWSSCKKGSPEGALGSPPFFLRIGGGVNSVVVEDSTKRKIWSTNTDFKGKIGCSLELNRDGAAVVRDSSDVAIWSTSTSGGKEALPHLWGSGDFLDLAHYSQAVMNEQPEDRSTMHLQLNKWAYSVQLVQESAIEMMNLEITDMMKPDSLLEKMSKMTIGYNDHIDRGERIRLDDCVVSFPGASQTWAELIGSTKVALACVFLPEPRAFMRVFKANHAADLDQPGSSKCWCPRLYGEQKDHGCVWFELWKANVEVALKNDQTLLVVYIDVPLTASPVPRFPLEVFRRVDQDKGLDGDLPNWDDPQADCKMKQWLGTSQRAEVAWLLQKRQEAKARDSDFKLKFVGLSDFEKLYGFEPEMGLEQKDTMSELLEILESQPARESDIIAELTENLSDEEKAAAKMAKVFVIIGETGAGKSSFCGLCDGSLRKDTEEDDWISNFKLGHGADAETNEPNLRFFHWLGQNDGSSFILMDTPGLEDTRGPKQDELHMQEVARQINRLPALHGVILLLKNDTRISNNMRKMFEFFQRLLGREMWSHCTVVVNSWGHDASSKKKRKKDAAQQFETNFRQTLTKPLPIAAGPGEHHGLGLTDHEAKQPQFFFIDTHYDREDEDEAESMCHELAQLKMRLHTPKEWKVKAVAHSTLLQSIIEAVKNHEPEALEKLLNDAMKMPNTLRPSDVTDEKMKALETKLQRLSGSKLLADATASLKRFEVEGGRSQADNFLQDVHRLKTLKVPSLSSELRSKLSDFDQLRAALQNALEGDEGLPQASGSRQFQERLHELQSEVKKKEHVEDVVRKFFEKYGLHDAACFGELLHWSLANERSSIEDLEQSAHLWSTKIAMSDIMRSKMGIVTRLNDAKVLMQPPMKPSADDIDSLLVLRVDARREGLNDAFLGEIEEVRWTYLLELLKSDYPEVMEMEKDLVEFKSSKVSEVKKKLEEAKQVKEVVQQLKNCELDRLPSLLDSLDRLALPQIPALEVARKVRDALKEDQTPVDTETFQLALNGVDGTWQLRAKAEEILLQAEDAAEAAKFYDIFDAAEAGNLPAVRGFVRRDADAVKQKSGLSWTALHCAAYGGGGDWPEVVRFLLEQRAEVHAVTDDSRNTALHVAARNGHLETARVLLDFKADVNLKDKAGQTPLDFAKSRKHTEVVKLLEAAKKR